MTKRDKGPLGVLPRLGLVDFARRKKKETAQEVVNRFRKRFPDVKIPDPGPEPQPLEGPLEPPIIEAAGVVWALETAWGLADKWGETTEQKEGLFRKFLPKILPKREKWERETARGLRRLLD